MHPAFQLIRERQRGVLGQVRFEDDVGSSFHLINESRRLVAATPLYQSVRYLFARSGGGLGPVKISHCVLIHLMTFHHKLPTVLARGPRSCTGAGRRDPHTTLEIHGASPAVAAARFVYTAKGQSSVMKIVESFFQVGDSIAERFFKSRSPSRLGDCLNLAPEVGRFGKQIDRLMELLSQSLNFLAIGRANVFGQAIDSFYDIIEWRLNFCGNEFFDEVGQELAQHVDRYRPVQVHDDASPLGLIVNGSAVREAV